MNVFCLFLIFLLGCAQAPTSKPKSDIRFTEINPDKLTALTRQNLDHLIQIYDLSPLLFAKDIYIQSGITSRSHPILTMGTRFAEKPHQLLSVFLHEQLHWWVGRNKSQVAKAIVELKKLYPKVPDPMAYQHLIICLIEFDALNFYLNKKQSQEIIRSFIYKDRVHPWAFVQVTRNYQALDVIVKKYNLRPKFLNQKPTKKPPVSSDNMLKNLYRSLSLSLTNSDPTPMVLI